MRVFYLDPGLLVPEGHHPMHCRLIAGEFAARGLETKVFSNVRIGPELRAELRAQPRFRYFTYDQTDGDPICGWMTAYDLGLQLTLEDLKGIGEIAATDLVYMSGMLPAGFAAITAWMARREIDAMPWVVADFCLPAGFRVERIAAGVTVTLLDPREDPRPVLFRYAAKRIAQHILPRLRLVTFLQESSDIYTKLLRCPVHTIPAPYQALTGRRNRVGARPIVIGVLGQQQVNKGYDLVPEIVRLLLARRPDLRFLIHNARPDAWGDAKMVATQTSLREMAAADDRITLSEVPAGKELWPSLLDRSDIVLCPYVPAEYVDRYSGVARDAVANAIPIVAPAGTSMEGLINEFGGAGTVFDRHEPEPIAAATLRLIEDFDRYAALAHDAATIWPTRYGARPMVDAVLSLMNDP